MFVLSNHSRAAEEKTGELLPTNVPKYTAETRSNIYVLTELYNLHMSLSKGSFHMLYCWLKVLLKFNVQYNVLSVK